MSQKLPVDGFKWLEKLSKFNERFIKNYDENRDKGYFLKVVWRRVALNGVALNLHSDLPFLTERNKIKKCNRLSRNIQDKESYIVQTSIKSWINI